MRSRSATKWVNSVLLALLGFASAVCFAAVTYTVSSVMDAILKVESGGKTFAINDNTTRRSYSFKSKQEAVKMADYLMSLNHNIDMGDYQVNSIQTKRGWTTNQLFDQAFNRKAAETIFGEWLVLARKKFGDSVLAWQRAIGGYNSGYTGLNNGNPVYTTKILRQMGVAEAPLDHSARAANVPPPASLGTGVEEEDEDEMWEPAKKSGAKAAKMADELMLAVTGLLLFVLLALLLPILGIKGVSLLFGAARKATSISTKAATNGAN